MKANSLAVYHQPPERFNCAQSILVGFQKITGNLLYPVEEFKSLGGGRAPGGTCGALHAACLIAPEFERSLKSKFKELAGSTLCKELKKDFKLPCQEAVGIAAELLEASIVAKSGNPA